MLLNPSLLHQSGKMLIAAIVGAFGIVGEDAGWKLARLHMVF